MVAKGFTRNYKPLELLTAEQVEKIRWGTLDILENTGVRFESERALALFEESGCRVDRDLMRVRIPALFVPPADTPQISKSPPPILFPFRGMVKVKSSKKFILRM